MHFQCSKELGSYMTSLEKSLHMGGSLKLKLFLFWVGSFIAKFITLILIAPNFHA